MFFELRVSTDFPQWKKMIMGVFDLGTIQYGIPKAYNAYINACTAPTQQRSVDEVKAIARAALMPNTDPGIVLQDGIKRSFGGDPKCAFNNPMAIRSPGSPPIFLTDLWLKAYQCEPRGFFESVRWSQASILHEIIHWVRDQALASDLIDNIDEAGEVFERAAFGTLQCVTTGNIAKAKAIIAKAQATYPGASWSEIWIKQHPNSTY